MSARLIATCKNRIRSKTYLLSTESMKLGIIGSWCKAPDVLTVLSHLWLVEIRPRYCINLGARAGYLREFFNCWLDTHYAFVERSLLDPDFLTAEKCQLFSCWLLRWQLWMSKGLRSAWISEGLFLVFFLMLSDQGPSARKQVRICNRFIKNKYWKAVNY